MKQAAQNRWKMLKIQMGQGFFKVVRKEVVDLSDFANAVEILWKVVLITVIVQIDLTQTFLIPHTMLSRTCLHTLRLVYRKANSIPRSTFFEILLPSSSTDVCI